MAIILVLTLVVLVQQSSFNKTFLLANTSYDIALTLRNAQTFGLASRARDTSVNTGYGIHFESTLPAPQLGMTKLFTLFADIYPGPGNTSENCHPVADISIPGARPGNCSYNAAQSEKVVDYTLGNEAIISRYCAYTASLEQWACSNFSGNLISSLDIVFARPNPDAFIYAGGFSYTAACLTVASSNAPGGPYHYVSVASSGAITANAASCP